jgi:Na+/melibiose symporter-like transporter
VDGVSSAATHGIVLMVSVFPALALFIAACVMVGYRLDEPFLKHIEESLSVRRNEHDSPST